MNQVFRFEDVTLRRGRKSILDAINWEVREGQHWVILGPNGAGKTSLLQIAAARLHPTSGRVWLLGEQLGRVDVFSLRPRIGLASASLTDRIPFGESALDAVVTGAYAVTGRWHENYSDWDVNRAGALLDLFGVGRLAQRTFGTLSEGERKRVQIARALMSDPEVLLLDEPSAALDLGGREELMAALAELAATPGSPVLVLVTHHVEEIPRGFTDMALMSDGEIIATGDLGLVCTATNLSAAFGLPLEVTRTGGRWTARAADL